MSLPFDPQLALGAEPAVTPGRHGALTVTQVSALIRDALAAGTPQAVRVIGQVSNLSCRKHWYFSLKDEQCVIGCVAWASTARTFRFTPQEGGEVVVSGRLDYYGPQGRTQMYVEAIEPVGAGALELRFRAMCDELRTMGWFDDRHKVPLPLLPRRVAVITSRGGAAVHDVIDTVRRRCPSVGLLIVDVRVQGDGAAAQIAAAIARVDGRRDELGVDAILVTRGGGSVEDLWAFNEREVAEAAFRCRLPLVAAIGHESDTTVIELVADVRAATPTQAAMRLVPDAAELRQQLDYLGHRALAALRRGLDAQRHRLARLERAPLLRAPGLLVRDTRQRLEALQRELASALRRAAAQRTVLAERHRRLRAAVAAAGRSRRQRLEGLARQLDSVDPHAVLRRGYTYTTTDRGRLVSSVRDVTPGQRLVTRVADGAIESVVDGGPGPRRPRQMDLFQGGG